MEGGTRWSQLPLALNEYFKDGLPSDYSFLYGVQY